MTRRTMCGFLLGLVLAIPASSVEPEPSCERQAVEAVRPAVERELRMGRSYAEAGYYRGYYSEVMMEQSRRTLAALLYREMKEFERKCLAMGKSVPYAIRRSECKSAINNFLAALFAKYKGVRSVTWDFNGDDPRASTWLARCAVLLTAMRSVPTAERDEQNRRTYRPGDREAPYRALSVLTNVARGHALVHGRRQVTMADIPLIVQVTASLVYVKEPMGHHSIQVTVDIYGHLVPGANRAAVNRLDEDSQPRLSATLPQPIQRKREQG